MDEVLTKPIDADDLRAVVARLVPATRSPSGVHTLPANVDLPTVDVVVLARLKQQAGRELVRAVIDLFSDAVREALAELHAAAARGDAPAVQAVAHTLKGTAASVGARHLAALCAEIESVAPTATPAELAVVLASASAEAAAAARALDRFRTADSAAFEVTALA